MSDERASIHEDKEAGGFTRKSVSRREFLKLAGIAGAGITVAGGLGGLLAACGGEEETTTTAGATTTTAGATTTTAGGATTTAGVTTSEKQQAAETLKLGCAQPFSGAYGFFGEVMKVGTEAYKDLINERGGWVIGDYQYKVEMKYPDDAMDIKRGPIVAQELIDWGAVCNVCDYTKFGPFTKVMNEAGLVCIGQMTSGIDLKTLPYFIGQSCEWGMPLFWNQFILDAWDDITGTCSFIYDWQKAQSDFINSKLREPDSEYSKRGIKINDPFVIAAGSQDFSSLLTKAADMGANLAGPPGGAGDQALIIRQAAELGIKMHWHSPAAVLDLKTVVDIAGPENMTDFTGAGSHPWLFQNTTNAVPDYLLADAIELRDRIEKSTGVPWNQGFYGFFEWAVGGMQIYLDLAKQAGSTEADAIMEKCIGGTVEEFTGKTTFGGTKAWGDTARIKPTNIMGVKVVGGDHFEWAFDGTMATEW